MTEFVGLQEAEESEVEGYLVKADCAACGARESTHAAPHYRFAAMCPACHKAGSWHDGKVLDRPTPSTKRVKMPERTWPDKNERVKEAPQPVHTSLMPRPEGLRVPGPVTELQRAAEGLSWGVEVTYSRGQAPGARTVKDWWAVRLTKGAFRAVAVYDGSTWGSMWGVAHMVHFPTMGAFKEYLCVEGSGTAREFIRDVRTASAEAARRAEVEKRCSRSDVHEAHPWKNSKGARKECPGRIKSKVSRVTDAGKKESGG